MSQDFTSLRDRQIALQDAQAKYANVADQRLRSIAQGGSPSPLASPWLALQQSMAGRTLGAAEDMPGIAQTGITAASKTPEQLREEKWAQAVRDAQALQGTGRNPRSFVP